MSKTLLSSNLTSKMKSSVFKFFALILIFSSFHTQVKATHMMGADISYRCLGGNNYAFNVKVYRDCRGIPFNSPTMAIRCVQGSSDNATPSYSRVSIRDITPTCSSGGKLCDPQNTTISSQDAAIEEHTFTFTYDFSTFKKNGCCKVQVGVGQCCRNGAITTGGAGNDFWTYCEIDICLKKCNSSPSLTSEPIAILCCNQPYYYNNGASDTTDFDSLSYNWDDPLTSWSGKTAWAGSNNSQNPFTVYWPSGYDKNKGARPDANPPIGTYLDPETGDIVFTPTDCSETTIASIRVTEWRKDSLGRYVKIGETRRDIQFIVKTCPGNNPPILNGPFKYTICAGSQICFTMTSDDKQFVPPPPAKANPPDTVRLTWNRGIPGATFNIVDKKARLQSGKFCWTPTKGQASDLPYSFAVTARDNSCPLNAVTVRSYSVKVNQIAEATRKINKLICGAYRIESFPFQNFKGNASYQWVVSDSKNKPLDNSFYFFKPKKGLMSNSKFDTIQFRKGGTYIIKHTINNPPLNCPSIYFDTLVVPPLLEVDLALGPDSFVCAGTTLRLGSKAKNGVPRFSYKWFTPKNFSKKDTFDYLDVYMSTHDTTFRVEITDDNKCVAFDTINVFLKPNPKVDMGPDLRICWYGEVTLKPDANNAYWVDPNLGDTLKQGDTLWWKWQYYGIDYSTSTSITTAKEGIYTVTVRDSLGCKWTDTMFLNVNDTLFPNAGPDQTKCYDDLLTLSATGLDTVKNQKKGTYIWFKGLPKSPPGFSTKQKVSFKTQKSDCYLLELQQQEDTTRCYGFDTICVIVNPLPVLTLTPPQKFCCDYGNIALGGPLFGSPVGGDWSCRQNAKLVVGNSFLTPLACDPKKAGVFTLIYTYTSPITSCTNVDSTRFTINPLPPLLLKGGFYCQDKIEAPLKPHIVAPVNINSMVVAQWKLLRTLKSRSGNWNTVDSLVYDADPSLNYDFRLRVDKKTIDLGTQAKDSIVLELTVQDGAGCFNKDTMTIYIWKLPVITFNIFPDLCINRGKVDLLKLNNTQPTGGCWTVINKTGFKDSSFLRPGMMSCDSLNTLLLSPQNGPGVYWLRYRHTASGCPVQKDTSLRINPLPNVTISLSPNKNNSIYCQDEGDVTLNGNPVGGIWSSSPLVGIISGGKFKPSAVQAADRDKKIKLTYYYKNPTTQCDTSKTLEVTVQSKPVVNILTNDTSYCRSNSMDIKLTAAFSFTSKITWYHSADIRRASFESNNQSSNNNPTLFTIRPRSDSATSILFSVNTEPEGVCPFAEDNITININPKPHATVVIDDPNGCLPHTANFTTTMNNFVNPATSKYTWNYGDGTSNDATQNASHIFNKVGTNNVNLTIVSAEGCDTIIGPMPIDVYPIPVADFTPNPNNKTTAALPRFRFTNQSVVSNALNSKIVSNYWDFGDLSQFLDTSTFQNPEFYYPGDTGTFNVSLIVTTNYGCSDTVIKPVRINPDVIVYIPNAFSPDGSGPLKNDKFRVVASGFLTYQILIYNRWGERLFESTNIDDPWDGYYQSVLSQMDAYIYQVNVTSYNNDLYKYNGTVILLR